MKYLFKPNKKYLIQHTKYFLTSVIQTLTPIKKNTNE